MGLFDDNPPAEDENDESPTSRRPRRGILEVATLGPPPPLLHARDGWTKAIMRPTASHKLLVELVHAGFASAPRVTSSQHAARTFRPRILVKQTLKCAAARH